MGGFILFRVQAPLLGPVLTDVVPYWRSRGGWLHWVLLALLRNGVHQLSGIKVSSGPCRLLESSGGMLRRWPGISKDHLKDQDVFVFYDRFEETELWGRNLAEAFHEVFSRAEYVVIFISQDYVSKTVATVMSYGRHSTG